MKNVFRLYKNMGETPLQCLECFKAAHPEHASLPMTYAGRLDPMAEGELLVLAGGEIRNKEAYLALDKVYECEILFGVATDTYDILGLVTEEDIRPVSRSDAESALAFLVGEREQPYPPYSSKAVEGKPLFSHAREGRNVAAPSRKIAVHDLAFVSWREADEKSLLAEIRRRIGLVSGDFRQAEILCRWEEVLSGERKVSLMKIRATVSSGTYMRSLAVEAGKRLGMPALAWSITRTAILPRHSSS